MSLGVVRYSILKRLDYPLCLIKGALQRSNYQVQLDNAICIIRTIFTEVACHAMIGDLTHIALWTKQHHYNPTAVAGRKR
jgi:hypothetical protein